MYRYDARWSYQDLMLHRVHEILMVASPYDAYILEEDGRLSEQILHEYLGLNLSSAPRVTRAPTAAKAMEMLSKRTYNLIITMARISDMDPITFAAEVKERYPRIPIILLVYDMSEVLHIPESVMKKTIEKVFIWNGDANVFPAIIKYIEDKKNVTRDIRVGDVRAIIVVEDNPGYYSLFLPMIYSEIIYHTRNLMDRSLNDTHRLLRMRGRPKILLANTYEEAKKYYERYRRNLLGIILDIRFPREGKLDKNAGYALARWVRKRDPLMPIILQSSQKGVVRKARELKARHLDKNSTTLLQDLREFILNNFGFGDFTFRLPDGTEITKASNLLELQECLATIPDESIVYHASQNHFSNWLAARGEFRTASKLRPLQISDFPDISALRRYLIEAVDAARRAQQRGRVAEFSEDSFDPSRTFTRIRGGSLGGKARGLAFANTMIAESGMEERFPEITIRIPRMAVIGTHEFDDFMSGNDLWDFALGATSDQKLQQQFLAAKLSERLEHFLRVYLEKVDYPLAVRSSGLMEDSPYQSLAGMYSTYMLPNISEDIEHRFRNLCDSIKLVFASMFRQEPKSIMESAKRRLEEEKMAVIIQEIVGRRYANRFYPNFSGLAQSVNYYPVSYLKREDGIAYVALGLGRTIVEGARSMRFCPKYPSILPQFYSPQAILENSQLEFYALDMMSDGYVSAAREGGDLQKYDIETAEHDGTLHYVASVLTDDDLLRDSLNYEGPRVITFSNILKWKTFPLAGILIELLEIGEHAIGCPVELEFAVNLLQQPEKPEFCLLQMRPMAADSYQRNLDLDTMSRDELFCSSDLSLGNGAIEGLQDIIYAKPDGFDPNTTRRIAREIEELNARMGRKTRFMLIGPGRWGSADPWLGIPVNWKQISRAKVIVEVGMKDLNIDPSFGSHFFQNVTSLRVGYLTINHKSRSDFVDWDWLDAHEAVTETEHLRWIHLDPPFNVHIDGRSGKGIAAKSDLSTSRANGK